MAIPSQPPLAQSPSPQTRRQHDRADGLQALWMPPFSITAAEDGPELQDPILQDLALGLSRVDGIVLSTVYMYQHGRAEASQLGANRPDAHLDMYLQQIEDAELGRQNFSSKYLESKELLEYWDLFLLMYQNIFTDLPAYAEEEGDGIGRLRELDVFESELGRLPALILAAVNSGLLNQNGRATIQRRWLIFDKLMGQHYSRTHTQRTSRSWSDIASQFTEVPSPDEGRRPNVDWTPTYMWLTFTTMVIFALPTVALGFQYSPHMHGTTLDADFWFLLQSCSMQFLGFLTVGLPMCKGKVLSGHSWYWSWCFIGLAMSCTLAAPFMYCKLQTEWASFLVIAAGTIQAFVTLQITFIANHSQQR